MKKRLLALFILALIICTCAGALKVMKGREKAADTDIVPETAKMPEPRPAETAEPEIPPFDSVCELTVKIDDEVKTLDMESYLIGVVAAEMPASFETEALKAQAVAARTYTIYKIRYGCANHPEADACDEITCCKAYSSPERLREVWGGNYETNLERVKTAVDETDGVVVTYESEPILAAFHSSSGGRTADSGEVWGKSLPYLASVESPESIDAVPNYIVEKKVPAEEFKKAVLERYPAAQFSDDMSAWVTISSISPSGRVEDAALGGVPVKGYNVRSLFDLRSTMFTVSADNEGIIFTTAGYGHGVGLSQYGANIMAREGSGYGEILAAYYTGTGLTRVRMD